MNATLTPERRARLERGLRIDWIGPVCGAVCMVALFVAGVVNQVPGMMTSAASGFATMVTIWAAVHFGIKKQLAEAK